MVRVIRDKKGFRFKLESPYFKDKKSLRKYVMSNFDMFIKEEEICTDSQRELANKAGEATQAYIDGVHGRTNTTTNEEFYELGLENAGKIRQK